MSHVSGRYIGIGTFGCNPHHHAAVELAQFGQEPIVVAVLDVASADAIVPMYEALYERVIGGGA